MDSQFFDYVGKIGAPGLIVLFVYLLYRGHLIPRKTHEDRVTDLSARIDELKIETGEWKKAFQEENKSNFLLIEQNNELLEGARLAQQVANAIPQPIRVVTPDGS